MTEAVAILAEKGRTRIVHSFAVLVRCCCMRQAREQKGRFIIWLSLLGVMGRASWQKKYTFYYHLDICVNPLQAHGTAESENQR